MYDDNISEMLKISERLLPLLPDGDCGHFCREVISDCRRWFENKDPKLALDIFSKALDSEDGHDFSEYLQDENDPLYYAVCCVCFNTVCYVTQAAIKGMDGYVLPETLDMFQDVDCLEDWEPEFLEEFKSECEEALRISKERGSN